MQNPMFAVSLSGGDGATRDIFTVFIFIVIGLILWGLGRYFFPRLSMPPKGMLIWDGLFILIAAIVIINFLASLTGHGFIKW
jgi:small-conductance mechanosensitive channel